MSRAVRRSVSERGSSPESTARDWPAPRRTTGGCVSRRRYLPFKPGIKRADRDNAIDVYIGDEYMDVLAEGAWQNIFTEKPPVFTAEEKRAWLDKNTEVSLGSDAFFPFGDNIERAHRSGVAYVAQPGGSIRDDHVIETCNKYRYDGNLRASACSITRKSQRGLMYAGCISPFLFHRKYRDTFMWKVEPSYEIKRSARMRARGRENIALRTARARRISQARFFFTLLQGFTGQG